MSAPLNLPEQAAPPSPELLFSPEAEPAAPMRDRITTNPMLEERNADSVLFTLDQIAPRPSTATPLDRIAMPAPDAGPNGSTDAQAGSGLIDIKSLMTQAAPSEDAAPADAAPLSEQVSSHLDSSTSIAAARSSLVGDVLSQSATDHNMSLPATPAAQRRGPLIVLSLLAAGALIAAIAAVVIRGV